ncbi:MAG: beta-ketoacyl-[acyl-carrier-protein] synthase family protein [Candidatus Omnitrophica bacterium]|nr:beta-ketoacyl-[acyl-carrier-protein] synthase family protein [Candidatus Omnitrophota bacterium]
MKKRVVVTGLGAVTPIGNGITAFRKNLKEGFSGLGPIQSFDASRFPVKNAFEIKNFEARVHGTHLLDPFIQYAVAAAGEAIQNAYFEIPQVDPYRIGISVSSSKGGVHTIDRFKERFFKHPSAILGARIYANSVPNFAAQWIARRWKINGPAKCYVAACATGTVAVIEGARMVSEGIVDYCVAGASDASITPLMMAGYHNMKALDPEDIRPFDKRRKGFMVGEGAGILFLETLESAKARGVRVYGEILGSAYGNHTSDLIKFEEADDALSHTLGKLFHSGSIRPEEIDYINLHGTGTHAGDIYETSELKKALGKRAHQIPMSSTKSMTGHMLGASGAVEIIASLLAMEEEFIPPTIHLEKPDPACDLNYTPIKSKPAKIRRALSVSMGFGGHVAVIGLGKI